MIFVSLKKLFRSPDLYGEAMLKPLKGTHQFFEKKIGQSEGLEKLSWRVAQAIAGVSVYPLSGSIAAAGICMKAKGFFDVIAHNNEVKQSLFEKKRFVRYFVPDLPEWEELTEEKMHAIRKEIDLASEQYRLFRCNIEIQDGKMVLSRVSGSFLEVR